MKKILSVILTLALVFSLAACGTAGNESSAPEKVQYADACAPILL